MSLLRSAVIVLALAGMPPGCSVPQRAPDPAPTARSIAQQVERTHGRDAWFARRAVRADLTIDFGDERVLDGRLSAATDLSASRLDFGNGVTLVYDGQTAWITPPRLEVDKARSHLLMWPYLLAMPFTLRDQGTTLTTEASLPLGGKRYDALRLGFADAPGGDWHIVYPDEETGRLKAVAFRAAFDPIPRSSEGEVHAVIYTDFTTVEGVAIPTRWMFYRWSRDQGTIGEPIARAALRDVRFFDPPPGFFERPSGAARRDSQPPPK
jgi:hypothetical protein